MTYVGGGGGGGGGVTGSGRARRRMALEGRAEGRLGGNRQPEPVRQMNE